MSYPLSRLTCGRNGSSRGPFVSFLLLKSLTCWQFHPKAQTAEVAGRHCELWRVKVPCSTLTHEDYENVAPSSTHLRLPGACPCSCSLPRGSLDESRHVRDKQRTEALAPLGKESHGIPKAECATRVHRYSSVCNRLTVPAPDESCSTTFATVTVRRPEYNIIPVLRMYPRREGKNHSVMDC